MTAVGAGAALCLPGAHTKRALCRPTESRRGGRHLLAGASSDARRDRPRRRRPIPTPRTHGPLAPGTWVDGGALVGVLWFRELVRQRWQEKARRVMSVSCLEGLPGAWGLSGL